MSHFHGDFLKVLQVRLGIPGHRIGERLDRGTGNQAAVDAGTLPCLDDVPGLMLDADLATEPSGRLGVGMYLNAQVGRRIEELD